MFYDPTNDVAYYARAKPHLAVRPTVRVTRDSIFDANARELLIAIAQEDRDRFDIMAFLVKLRQLRLDVPHGSINGIDLFWTGASATEFHLSIARLTTLVELAGKYDWGADFYQFVERCTREILDARITEDFRPQFDRSWYEHELVPDIVAPLTARGHAVLEILSVEPSAYLSWDSFNPVIGQTDVALPALTRTACEYAEAQHEEWSGRSALRDFARGPRGS